jgi:hypothetical protein
MTLIILPSVTWTIKKFPAKLFSAHPHTNAPDGGIKEIKPVGSRKWGYFSAALCAFIWGVGPTQELLTDMQAVASS